MGEPKDITTSLEASDTDVTDLKKAHFAGTADLTKATRMAAPVQQLNTGLNQQLLNMLTIGKTFHQFQGLDRCIRILEQGSTNQRHCLSMMVKNLTTNTLMCSSCDRIKDPNARPQTINSSMIRLSQKELEECGLDKDPLLNAKPEPIKPVKRLKEPKAETVTPRRVKVKKPNTVTIELSMEELKSNPNVLNVMLQKTLEAIFELPVSNFREAEAIRVVKERVEGLMTDGQGD